MTPTDQPTTQNKPNNVNIRSETPRTCVKSSFEICIHSTPANSRNIAAIATPTGHMRRTGSSSGEQSAPSRSKSVNRIRHGNALGICMKRGAPKTRDYAQRMASTAPPNVTPVEIWLHEELDHPQHTAVLDS